MISATVTFKPGSQPAQITLERASDKNPWRFLSADAALVLVPVCGHSARLVETPPLFERLEVWPCAWGFPPDLAEAHPQAVEQMRKELAMPFDEWFSHIGIKELWQRVATEDMRRSRLAASPAPWSYPPELAKTHSDVVERMRTAYTQAKAAIAFDNWFARFGREELWRRVATDEMRREWLNTADFDECGPGPGFALYIWAKPDTTPWPCIAERDLLRIRFRADFHSGDRGETIYLAECLKQPLTPEEVQASPAFVAEQARRIAELNQVADRLERNAGEVAKATQIADLYSDPSYLDATVAAVKREVPKAFVEYCKSQLHGGGKFPSVRTAHRALKTLPLLKPLRTETDQQTTCWRWLKIVHEELHKRGLVSARTKGPAAQRVRDYDVEKSAAPPTATLEDLEADEERDGRTDRDTRAQELSDPQDQP